MELPNCQLVSLLTYRFHYAASDGIFSRSYISQPYIDLNFREDDGFLNSLSAPQETKAEKLIRTGLKNPFEVKYEEYLKTQLHDKGHDELLQYHDPDHGSDTDFEEPDMDLIEDHVKNKPKVEDSDSEVEQEVKPATPACNKRRKLDTVAKDDGDPGVYQMRISLLEPPRNETKCVKGMHILEDFL